MTKRTRILVPPPPLALPCPSLPQYSDVCIIAGNHIQPGGLILRVRLYLLPQFEIKCLGKYLHLTCVEMWRFSSFPRKILCQSQDMIQFLGEDKEWQGACICFSSTLHGNKRLTTNSHSLEAIFVVHSGPATKKSLFFCLTTRTVHCLMLFTVFFIHRNCPHFM